MFVDLSRPELVLNHTRNFYLSTDEGVSVGLWWVVFPPRSFVHLRSSVLEIWLR